MTLIVLDATFDVSVIGLPIAIALHFLVIYVDRKRRRVKTLFSVTYQTVDVDDNLCLEDETALCTVTS